MLLEASKPLQENAACLLYLVYEDVQDPNVIWVEDFWTSSEAVPFSANSCVADYSRQLLMLRAEICSLLAQITK